MASDGAPEALLKLLDRAEELAVRQRCEAASAKFLEAIALARATTPQQSLLRADALMGHAESAFAQQAQLGMRNGSASGRASYAAEQALCAVSYASLLEALPILFARAEANTLLPGRVPADEEESRLRLALLNFARNDNSAAALAAQEADARAARHGQCLGYQLFLQAASHSFRALYPQLYHNPFPPQRWRVDMDDADAQKEFQMLNHCVTNAVAYMGDCFNGGQDFARFGVQWQLGDAHELLDVTRLCNIVSGFLQATQTDNISNSFRRELDELWQSPQLVNLRLAWAEMKPRHFRHIRDAKQRADADVARLGLATCANAGCGAKESCPKAFKTCARCHSVVYCSRNCQLAAWPAHKRDCKRIAAERAASDAGAPEWRSD
jgi:hypothetical protein